MAEETAQCVPLSLLCVERHPFCEIVRYQESK